MTTTKSRQSTDDHLTDEVLQNAHDLPRNASSANATPVSMVQKPLTRKDVCGLLGISVRTTQYWVEQGRLPEPLCIGRKRYWLPHQLEKLLQPQAQELCLQSMEAAQPPGLPVTETQGPTEVARTRKRRKKSSESIPCSESVKTRTQSKCEEIKRRLNLIPADLTV
ncbi:MAG: helix-turn-helix domain-containing protein [Burkholderiales bacterium]